MQLDTSFHGAHVTRPDMQICGFKCIHLEADAAAEITFHLKTAQLGCYNEHVDFVVEPGDPEVLVGDSSGDLPPRRTA